MEENKGSTNANYFKTSFLEVWCCGVCGEEKIVHTCVNKKQPLTIYYIKDMAKKLWNSL